MTTSISLPSTNVIWTGDYEQGQEDIMLTYGLSSTQQRNQLLSGDFFSAGLTKGLENHVGFEMWQNGRLIALSDIIVERTKGGDTISYSVACRGWLSAEGADAEIMDVLSEKVAKACSYAIIEDVLTQENARQYNVRTNIDNGYLNDVDDDDYDDGHPAINHVVKIDETLAYYACRMIYQDAHLEPKQILSKITNENDLAPDSFEVGCRYLFGIDRGPHGISEIILEVVNVPKFNRFVRPGFITVKNMEGVQVQLYIEHIAWVAPAGEVGQ